MSRRLKPSEIEDRLIQRIIDRIKTIEKEYGVDKTRRACQRYAKLKLDEKNLQEQIAYREKELNQLKQKSLR
jgi:hypothetical protein